MSRMFSRQVEVEKLKLRDNQLKYWDFISKVQFRFLKSKVRVQKGHIHVRIMDRLVNAIDTNGH